jgi:hypothetical protein
MDGAATMSEIRRTYRTPVHILLPKLLKSRDDWKAKSHQRQAKLKAAHIKIRDLAASRARWRQRAEALAEENRRLQGRAARAASERERPAAATPPAEAKKK